MRTCRGSLLGLIADLRNLVAEGLTAADADLVLEKSAVSLEERREIRRILEAMESAEYGSGDLGETVEILNAVDRLLPSLARRLERGV